MAGARGKMDLVFKDNPPPGINATQLHVVSGRNVVERARLQTALTNNDQPGLFQELDTHTFSPVRAA